MLVGRTIAFALARKRVLDRLVDLRAWRVLILETGQFDRAWSQRLATFVLSMVAMSAQPIFACDEFASRLIKREFTPAIAGLGCGPLVRAGLDRSDHQLTNVCYESTGPISKLRLSATLTCKTSDGAFVRSSVTEKIWVQVEVQGSDCSVMNVEAGAAGSLAASSLKSLDTGNALREVLQREVNKLCN